MIMIHESRIHENNGIKPKSEHFLFGKCSTPPKNFFKVRSQLLSNL